MKKNTCFTQLICCFLTLFLVVAITPQYALAKSEDSVGWIYFLKYGSNASEIWRVKSDGSTKTPERVSANFSIGKENKDYLVRGGDYFYYLSNGTSLFRIPDKMPEEGQHSRILVDHDNDTLDFKVDGDYVYYLNDKNRIIRFKANAVDNKEITATSKEIVNMIDPNFKFFFIMDGRLYFNALKDGRTTWVASRPVDGSGKTQWICAGALEASSMAQKNGKNLYMLVNTNPKETQYSTDCMVLYEVPLKGGVGKGKNTKKIDLNGIYSGMWTEKYFVYTNNVTYDENDNPMGTAMALDLNGKSFKLHDKYIYEIVNVDGGTKHVFTDGYKTYSATITSKGISTKKDLKVNNTFYVRNLKANEKVRNTALFGSKGTYILDNKLKATKLVGVEWDVCFYYNDIAGIFYINAGDEGKLYKASEDGKQKIKLTDDKILRILFAEPVK